MNYRNEDMISLKDFPVLVIIVIAFAVLALSMIDIHAESGEQAKAASSSQSTGQ